MSQTFGVFLIAAAACAAAALWLLRAYRRAGAAQARPALLACGAIAVLALGVYLAIGRPDLADAPFTQRLQALKQRDPSTYSIDEALAILHAASRDRPRDARPLLYSGQLLLEGGRAEEAARAFDAALRRDPTLVDAIMGLGRAMVRIDNGRVSGEAQRLFEQAGAASDDPAPWIYQAMAAMQSNREADAQRLWGQALRRMARDDPRRAMAQQMSTGQGGRQPGR